MNAATSKSLDVSVEAMPGLERRITVRVPSVDIEREVAVRLAKVGKTAKLKGFRPGKVPQKIVRQYYGGQVREEVVSDVIRASYSRAIAEHKLNPAGGPRIEPVDQAASDADHFSYRAVFEVYPEISLRSLDSLSLEVPKVEIGEPDVDAMLEKLREQRATWEAVERQSEAKDRVVIDFTGTLDGQPFPGGEGKEIAIIVGGNQVLEDFDNALVSVAAGDSKTATVKFPEDYPTAELAGKQAEFAITVHRVEERRYPPLDDAFAEVFGVPDGGMAGLRTEVRKNMERELAERRNNEVKTRVFNALIQANQVTVPRALVEQEIASLQQESMRQMGVKDPKQAPARERFVSLAERRVKIGLLIQEVLQTHKITLDQARVDKRVKELAAPYEKPEEAAQYYRSNRGMMAQVEAAVLEDQVADFLLQHAKTTEKSHTFQEFMGA